jgi:hypothetical protein
VALPKEKHTHKFKRLKYKSGNSIFFCALPDCSTKLGTALALGKRSICWRCGEHFIMNEYSIRLAKPHCEACHQSKDSTILPEMKNTTGVVNLNELALTYNTPMIKSPMEVNDLAARLNKITSDIENAENEEEL